MAHELAANGIRVNTVEPGHISTHFERLAYDEETLAQAGVSDNGILFFDGEGPEKCQRSTSGLTEFRRSRAQRPKSGKRKLRIQTAAAYVGWMCRNPRLNYFQAGGVGGRKSG